MIKIIPHLLTSANIAMGILAILVCDPLLSPLFLVIGAAFDAFDGAIARMLEIESEFGAHLDSLADMVTFGIAPAYCISLLYLEHDILIAVVVIWTSLCAAWRLAYFNTLPYSINFRGLPSPAYAIFLVGLMAAIHYDFQFSKYMSYEIIAGIPVLAIAIVLAGTMMIIPIRFLSFKGLKIRKNKVGFLLIGLIALAIFLYRPEHSVWLGILAYITLSIIYMIIFKKSEK